MTNYLEQTGTKYITSFNGGLPELVNEYGSLKNLLKTVLTEPYNTKPISSVVKKDLLYMEVEVGFGHGYGKDQVIRIEGFEEASLNKEYRIVEVTEDTFLVLTPTPSTDNYTGVDLIVTGVPLGYDIAFEDDLDGVICFKNKSKKSPAILKVIDKIPPNAYEETWSKYARVAVGQYIDTKGNFIDNVKAPYHPDHVDAELHGNMVRGVEGIHGFAKWTYSLRDGYDSQENVPPREDYQGKWSIVGDDKTFYLMIHTTGVHDSSDYGFDLVGYGTYVSYNPLDTFNVCLQAKDGFIAANSNDNNNPSRPRSFFGAINYSYSGFILTDNMNNHKAGYNRSFTVGYYLSKNNPNHPWKTDTVRGYTPDLKLLKTDLIIKDHLGFLRGTHRGIYNLYDRFDHLDTFVDSEGYLLKTVQDPVHENGYSKAPVLFSLNNWEDV